MRAGNRVFVGGLLPADAGGVPPRARPSPGYPNHSDPLALQSRLLLGRLDATLRGAGSGLGDVVRLDQWFAGPEDWTAGSEWSGITISRYMEARAGKFPGGVPASVAVAVRRLPVAGGLVGLDALAVVGEEKEVLTPEPDDDRRPYPFGARVGDHVHLSGELPTDWRGEGGSAVAAEARLDETLWYGDPVRAQTDLLLRRLSRTAEKAGTGLSRTAHATVFLTDPRDLVGFEEAWREWFPEGRAPARTIIPGAGLTCRGCRVEVVLDLLMPGASDPEPVSPEGMPLPPGHEAPAVRAGELLYVSGQMAVDKEGADPRGLPDPHFPDLSSPPAAQLEIVLERLAKICEAAGTDLENLARLRLFFSDLPDFGAVPRVLGECFGEELPTGTVLGVGPLLVPGCVVLADAVAHVPEGDES